MDLKKLIEIVEYDDRLPRMSRREWMKLVGAAGALAFSGSGCSTLENPVEVDAQLESHPAIPTPTGGCYAGWHNDVVQDTLWGELYEEIWKKKMDQASEVRHLTRHKERFGMLPIVHSFSHKHTKEDFYPRNLIEGAHEMGVYPLMRFYPRVSWKRTSQGALDEDM